MPTIRSQHVDESARQRQVRPARIGRDVEQHDHALAAVCGGDERRAVAERRPGAVGKSGFRLGQHLPRHGDVVRHGIAPNGPSRENDASCCG